MKESVLLYVVNESEYTEVKDSSVIPIKSLSFRYFTAFFVLSVLSFTSAEILSKAYPLALRAGIDASWSAS